MRAALAALFGAVCVGLGLFAGAVAPIQPAQAQDAAPAKAADLAGTVWKIAVHRTDKETWNSRPMDYEYTVAFLGGGEALLAYQEPRALPDNAIVSVKVSGNRITLKDSVKDMTFDFANGATRGNGKSGIFRFDVKAFRFERRIDLNAYEFVGLLNYSTCDFVSRQMDAAMDGFFNIDTAGRLQGAEENVRYGRLVRAGNRMRNDNDRFEDVKKFYESRMAEMKGCTVVVDGVRYGLEALIEPKPGEVEDKTGVIYRLKNAPERLQALRAAVIADWRAAPWVYVYAGIDTEGEVRKLEGPLSARYGWVSLSDAPPSSAPQKEIPTMQALLDDADAAETAGEPLKAARLRNDACVRYGFQTACYQVALAYRDGKGVIQWQGRGEEELERVCGMDHAAACFDYGELLTEDTDQDRRAKGAYALQKACNLKDGAACTNLGLFMEGETQLIMGGDVQTAGTKYIVALKLYERGCALGSPQGCANAAITYVNGEDGVPVDPAKAAEFHGKACQLGRQKSCEQVSAQEPG